MATSSTHSIWTPSKRSSISFSCLFNCSHTTPWEGDKFNYFEMISSEQTYAASSGPVSYEYTTLCLKLKLWKLVGKISVGCWFDSRQRQIHPYRQPKILHNSIACNSRGSMMRSAVLKGLIQLLSVRACEVKRLLGETIMPS